MKLVPLVLGISLAANAAFVTLYFVHAASGPSGSTAAVSVANKTPASPATSPTSEFTPAQNAALAQVWTQLQTGDLKTLIARLRAAGFSASMIRAIVAAQVNEQFSARRRELFAAQEDRPFWKSQQNPFGDPKLQASLRAISKEQGDLLKSLLGADYMPGGEELRAVLRRQYGNLSAEKLAQLQSINSDYNELNQDIYAKTNGVMLAEDREKIAFLEKEKLADIARTLTPQEFEEFQFRTSPTANQLRAKLANFEVSEAEFRSIYKLQAAFDAQYNVRDGASFEMMRNRTEAEKQLQAAILATLPPERAADYKIATDPQYQQVNRLVARLELPPTTTQQVVSVQQDIQQRANALRTDRTLTPDARNAQLAALNEEATTKLTTALTPRGLEAYKQNGGYWLQNLQPRPAPAPPIPARPIGG